MANSNKEQETKQLKEESSIELSEQSQKQKNTSCHKRYFLINGFAILLAIVALVITICSAQFNYKLQKKLLDKNTKLSTEIDELKQQQTNSQAQVDAKAENIQQTQASFQNKLDQLNKQLQIAMNQQFYQNQDWLLLKARYYLELAQINAHWSDNFSAAVSLLQQTDKLLEPLHAPKILEVRQAIAKEITQLKATPSVDIAGLLSQLDAAQISVSNLTIQPTSDENKSAAETKVQKTANSSAWHNRLQESVNLLKKLVVIRRDDEQIKPLMSPLFVSILRESIRLNLQEAQWAILNNDSIVYQLALKQASLNIKRTFDETAQNTQALLKQLNDLQQITIIQEKPSVELALPLLNQLIDHKELLVNSVSNSGQGENRP